ncbi:MAG: hypothetical protein ACI4V1_02885 [Eubacteriales bacterium]
MLVGILIVSLLGAVSWILLENPQIFEIKKDSDKVTSMYSDKLYSYNFYPTDYDLNPEEDERYMQYDRYVYYKNGNVSQAILEGEEDAYGPAVKFFTEYFATIIAGDAETYNTYFTDHYYESNEPYDRFAPQMLYNIEVEQLSETTNEDGTTVWAFNVTYMIHRNDGTFRNDLDSDSSKKLYFELVQGKDGIVKIDRITYYKR